jgi:hypothetical protein
MIQLPRVFVGTMYTQEGEFEACLKQVQAQKGVTVSHVIISGLREKEAHNALWHAWKHQGPHHDLFVKIDADTVLASANTLAQIWEQFAANPRVTGLQAPLHDYMTDSYINGLNAFSTRVVFNDTQDELYCDRHVDTGHDIVLRDKELPTTLRPAGFHCWNSTDKQAFHFGVHRMLKGQQAIIDMVHKAWDRDHDRSRAFALMGARMATRFTLNRKFNYADPLFQAVFEEASQNYAELVTHVLDGNPNKVT